jgi:hypothetical protein
MLVSPTWLDRPDLARVPLLICFSGGDAKQNCAWSELSQFVSLEDILDVSTLDLKELRSGSLQEKNTLLLALDRVLVAGLEVEFSAGDREQHHITIPRDAHARTSYPVEMLLATLRFRRTGRTLDLHFPRKELTEFFACEEGLDPPAT